MHQQLKEGLVADALACRELSRLRHVGFWQSQGYLNAGGPVQLADKTRSLRHVSFLSGPADFCFTNSRPWRLAHQFASSSSVMNLGMAIDFFFIASLPSHAPGEVVPHLPGIQIVSGHNPELLIALDHDNSQQAARSRFAVIYVARFTLHVLFINRDRAIRGFRGASPQGRYFRVTQIGLDHAMLRSAWITRT